MSDTDRPDRSARPDHLVVIADRTPGPHAADSDDLFWWLPILGPTASWLAFLLARRAANGDTRWDTSDLARTVGLGGSESSLWRSLDRLTMFHVATFQATDVMTIRLQLPALKPSHIDRLPAFMADMYRCTNAA